MANEAIFVSYRRDDSADAAGRVYDRMRAAFGERSVFKDVDAIPAGQNFREHIRSVLGRCRVCLALIGPSWLNAQGDDGSRRLDNPDDMVRVEIETALSLGLTVIPVLLGGAALPTGALLPGKLAGLSSLHASEIRRDPDFHKDMDKLIGDLRRNALRPLSLRRRFTRAGVVLSLALGVFAIGVVGAIWTLKTAERVEAQQDENRRQRVLAELGLDGQTADDNSASIRLIELLGEPADGATQREYQGRFEAVGLNPYWAMQLRDDRVVFQLDHGAEFESYAGARPEFYQGGLAIPFENNGTYYSFVVRNEPCQLMNGVETDYTAYAVVDRVVFSGCASRGLSGDWPFDRAGAERWGLSPPDAHD